jgi:hypothetical protein
MSVTIRVTVETNVDSVAKVLMLADLPDKPRPAHVRAAVGDILARNGLHGALRRYSAQLHDLSSDDESAPTMPGSPGSAPWPARRFHHRTASSHRAARTGRPASHRGPDRRLTSPPRRFGRLTATTDRSSALRRVHVADRDPSAAAVPAARRRPDRCGRSVRRSWGSCCAVLPPSARRSAAQCPTGAGSPSSAGQGSPAPAA